MTIGAQLQQARNARKLTFAEVTEKTKIQPWVLEAIEADRLPEIMSPIYVKGFIATYAKFLRVEPEPLLAQLMWPKPEEPAAAESLPPAQPSLPPITIRWPTIPRPVLRRAAVAAVAVAVVAGVAVGKPRITLPKFSLPKFSLPQIAKAKPSSQPAKKKAVKPKPLAATPKPAPKPVATAAAPKTTAQTEAPAPAVQAASVAPVGEALKPPAAPALHIVPSQPMELRVTATKTTWIKIWADGKLLSQQRLPRGAKERWTAKRQFQLIIAKPSQVDVTLNGQSISPFTIAHQGRVLITHNGVTRLPESP
ncbi:MAG: DUF4115 domain-containing protein [Candidatus Omnitrophica bacterium]|nr:DUF4115 domain-containing protein [Candidatus Omnitrophota bacterium]